MVCGSESVTRAVSHWEKKGRIEDPCSDSTVFDPELRPKGARRSQAGGNALACAVQGRGAFLWRTVIPCCTSRSPRGPLADSWGHLEHAQNCQLRFTA